MFKKNGKRYVSMCLAVLLLLAAIPLQSVWGEEEPNGEALLPSTEEAEVDGQTDGEEETTPAGISLTDDEEINEILQSQAQTSEEGTGQEGMHRRGKKKNPCRWCGQMVTPLQW